MTYWILILLIPFVMACSDTKVTSDSDVLLIDEDTLIVDEDSLLCDEDTEELLLDEDLT